MTKDNTRQIIHDRLNAYEKTVQKRIALVRKRIDEDCYSDGDKSKVWLEQFTKGKGLDICCGHVPLSGAEGIDSVWFYARTGSGGLGPLCNLRVDGDDLSYYGGNELDFVVSNYLEAFASPLKALNEWYRVLKKGGVLALIVCNTEKYTNKLGPLENKNRANMFTKTTLTFFLRRAEFIDIQIEEFHNTLRVQTRK